MRQERSVKKAVVNTFGYFGYFFSFLLWLWAALLYFSAVQSAILWVAPDASAPVRQTPSFTVALPDPVTTAITTVVVVVMIAITLYVLIKLPMNIVKSGNTIVHKTSRAAVPMVIKAQHKKDIKKNRTILTPKVVLIVKIILIVIPTILVATSGMIATLPIDYSIATIVGYILTIASGVFFVIQYLMAWALRVALMKLR